MTMKAVLSGHTHGLGRALFSTLRARGIAVLGMARGRLPVADDNGSAQVTLDLADAGALTAWLAGDTLARFLAGPGPVMLINNAGTLGPVAPAGRQGAAAIAQAVALNVAAPLALTDAVIAAASGAEERRIVHISSGAARTAYAGWSVYCATKAALDQHARAAALDAPPGTRIVSLAPGVIDTAMQAQIRATAVADFPSRARFEALQRDGALLSPEDCAQRLVDYLLSERFGGEAVADLRTALP